MRTPRECAGALAELYPKAFGGETSGAYRIDREGLKGITGRPVLHQTIIEDIADWLVEYGFILIDRDQYFVLMRPAALDGIRRATADVLEAYRHPVDFGGPYDN